VTRLALTQMVYASKPFGFNVAALDDILTVSRFNNARDGITGAITSATPAQKLAMFERLAAEAV
jgi:hypothetical protein